MRIIRRSYAFRVQPNPGYSQSYDWATGLTTRTPNPPRPAFRVEATGDDVESARRMAAGQYGVPIDAISPVAREDGEPEYREYEEDASDARSLRQRGRDGEDEFGR